MKLSSCGKGRQRFVLAFLLTIAVVQFFPLASYAQNLGAAPATGQAVQGQTAAQPGMTRKDLLKVFTTEGGLSNRSRRTYVLKQCPYIKVDVEFAAATNEQDRLAEMPEDKIATISRAYLDFSIMD